LSAKLLKIIENLCIQEVSAPGWSGLTCDHPEELHDPKTGKCRGFLEFGWGDHPCDCTAYKSEEEVKDDKKRRIKSKTSRS
jgi:hypothetical protein